MAGAGAPTEEAGLSLAGALAGRPRGGGGGGGGPGAARKALSVAQRGDGAALVAALSAVSGSEDSAVVDALAVGLRDGEGCSLLHRACRFGNWSGAAWLLSRGADPDAPNALFKTPVHEAAASGSAELVRLLVAEHGGEPAPTKYNAWSPFHYSCEKGHAEVARVLLDAVAQRHGADGVRTLLAARNLEGSPALYLAARSGSRDTVALLLAAGADPDAGNNNQRAPAHACCMTGAIDSLRLLVRAGARIGLSHARDSSGATVWHEAAGRGRVDVLEALRDELAAHAPFPGPDEPAGRDRAGRHPLHAAARSGHDACVALLVALLLRVGEQQSRPGPLDMTDVDGATALMLAATHGHRGVLSLLLQAGASTEARSFVGGHSALDLSVMWKRHDCERLLASDATASQLANDAIDANAAASRLVGEANDASFQAYGASHRLANDASLASNDARHLANGDASHEHQREPRTASERATSQPAMRATIHEPA